jgi:hypothetical protein
VFSRESKSRNKVSVGEPAEGSLSNTLSLCVTVPFESVDWLNAVSAFVAHIRGRSDDRIGRLRANCMCGVVNA